MKILSPHFQDESEFLPKRFLFLRAQAPAQGEEVDDDEDEDEDAAQRGAAPEGTLAEEERLKVPGRVDDKQEEKLKEIGKIFTLSDKEFREKYGLAPNAPVNFTIRKEKFEELMEDFARSASESTFNAVQSLKAKKGVEGVVEEAMNVLQSLDVETVKGQGYEASEEEKSLYGHLAKSIGKMGLKHEDLQKTRKLTLDLKLKEMQHKDAKAEWEMKDFDIKKLAAEEQKVRASAEKWKEALQRPFNTAILGLGGLAVLGKVPLIAALAAFIPVAVPYLGIGAAGVLGLKILSKIPVSPLISAGFWLRRPSVWKEAGAKHKAEKAELKAKALLDSHNNRVSKKFGRIQDNMTMLENEHKTAKDALELLTKQRASYDLEQRANGPSVHLTAQMNDTESQIKELSAALVRYEKALEAMKDVKRMFTLNEKYSSTSVSDTILNQLYAANLNPELYDEVVKFTKTQDKTTKETQEKLGKEKKEELAQATRSLGNAAKDQLRRYLAGMRTERPQERATLERYLRSSFPELASLQESNEKLYETLIEIGMLPPGNRYRNEVRKILKSAAALPEQEATGLDAIPERIISREHKEMITKVLTQVAARGNPTLKTIFMDAPDSKSLSLLSRFFERLPSYPRLGAPPIDAVKVELLLRALSQIKSYEKVRGAKASASTLSSLYQALEESMSRALTLDLAIGNLHRRIRLAMQGIPQRFATTYAKQAKRSAPIFASPLGRFSLNVLGERYSGLRQETDALGNALENIRDTLWPNVRPEDQSYLLLAASQAAKASETGEAGSAVQRYCEALKKMVLVENIQKHLIEKTLRDPDVHVRSLGDFVRDSEGHAKIIGNPLEALVSIYPNLANATEAQLIAARNAVREFSVSGYKVMGRGPVERLIPDTIENVKAGILHELFQDPDNPASTEARGAGDEKIFREAIIANNPPDQVHRMIARFDGSYQNAFATVMPRGEAGGNIQGLREYIGGMNQAQTEQYLMLTDAILIFCEIFENEIIFKDAKAAINHTRSGEALYTDYINFYNSQEGINALFRLAHQHFGQVFVQEAAPGGMNTVANLQEWLKSTASFDQSKAMKTLLVSMIGPEPTSQYILNDAKDNFKARAAVEAPVAQEAVEIVSLKNELVELEKGFTTIGTLYFINSSGNSEKSSIALHASPFGPGNPMDPANIIVWATQQKTDSSVTATSQSLADLNMKISKISATEWQINNVALIDLSPQEKERVENNVKALKKQMGIMDIDEANEIKKIPFVFIDNGRLTVNSPNRPVFDEVMLYKTSTTTT